MTEKRYVAQGVTSSPRPAGVVPGFEVIKVIDRDDLGVRYLATEASTGELRTIRVVERSVAEGRHDELHQLWERLLLQPRDPALATVVAHGTTTDDAPWVATGALAGVTGAVSLLAAAATLTFGGSANVVLGPHVPDTMLEAPTGGGAPPPRAAPPAASTQASATVRPATTTPGPRARASAPTQPSAMVRATTTLAVARAELVEARSDVPTLCPRGESPDTARIAASVRNADDVISVDVRAAQAGSTVTSAMVPAGEGDARAGVSPGPGLTLFSGSLGPFDAPGTVVWTVEAQTRSSGTLRLQGAAIRVLSC